MAGSDATKSSPDYQGGENTSGSNCPCCNAWKKRVATAAQEECSSEQPQPQEQFGEFFVLRNARVFTLDDDETETANTDPLILDVWIGGGKTLALTPPSASEMCPSIPGLQEIDVEGMHVVPGLVDIHQHIIGGGGEAGFGSRTPEAALEDLIEASVTTFVSTFGTDTVTRGMESLLAKTRSLSSNTGLTGLAWLGGYSFPIENTITGSVRRDVTLIPEIIGVGELAISDHRGSYPSTNELVRLASEVRVAGLLSSKAGVTYLHLGEDDSGLEPLQRVVERNPMLLQHLVPTHLERSPQLIKEGFEWMQMGGRADFSGWPERQRPAIQQYMKTMKGHALIRDNLSISSDSYGSINVFDEKTGKLIKYTYGRPNALLKTLFALVYTDGVPMDTALRFFCRNPASVIKMDGAPMYKGRIRVGGDADLVVLKLPPLPLPNDYPCTESFGMKWPSTQGVLQYVIARGKVLKSPSSE